VKKLQLQDALTQDNALHSYGRKSAFVAVWFGLTEDQRLYIE